MSYDNLWCFVHLQQVLETRDHEMCIEYRPFKVIIPNFDLLIAAVSSEDLEKEHK